MFIDPSMGGQIYNPWRVQSPILQRYGEPNPYIGLQRQEQEQSNKTSYRFFGTGQRDDNQPNLRVFRSYF